MIKWLFLSVWVILLLPFPAFAADSFTLPEAVHKGVHTNPEYNVAAMQKAAAAERLVQAKALYLPSIDLQADTGRERTSAIGSSAAQSMWRRRGSLTLHQLLFDGWGTGNEIKAQGFRVESAAHRVEEVTEFLGLDIVQAYLDVLRQRRLLAIARQNVDDHLNIWNKIKEGAKGGTATEGDVSQSESRVTNARATVASVEQNLRQAEALFIEKVGEMPKELAAPDVPKKELPATMDEAIRAALASSPTLAAYQSDIKTAQADYAGTVSPLYPRIGLELNDTESINTGGIRGDQNGFSALAVARWNLYRGGADLARRREYAHRQAEAEARAALTMRQIEGDVRNTWAAMEAAVSRSAEYQKQTKANEKVVGVYLDQFTLARRSLLDVLDSQSELFATRSNYINAVFTEEFAVFRLLALQGKMLGILGVGPPVQTARRESY